MRKLLVFGATVLLSVYIVLVEINPEEGTSMYCNGPAYETTLGPDYEGENSTEEITKLLDTIEPLTEWIILDNICLVCAEWRAIRWMNYVTCVQNRLIEGSRI
jgi:hypothetical protein